MSKTCKRLGLGYNGASSEYFHDVPDTRFQRVLAYLGACASGRSAMGGSSFRDFWAGRVRYRPKWRHGYSRNSRARSIWADCNWLVGRLIVRGYLESYRDATAHDVWEALLHAERDSRRP